jgi:AcrR family transcriptional regulator
MAPVKPSKRQQNKIDCERTILKVSRRLFTRMGYKETRMEDIARKAEVSKATLYNYFPNKESLLIGTAAEIMRELQNTDAKLVRSGTPAKERFVTAYRILAYGSLQYPELVRLIVYYHSLEGHELYQSLMPVLNLFHDILESLYDESEKAESGTGDADDQLGYSGVAESAKSPAKTHYVDAGLEFFLGMYYTILFHSGLTYPEDTDEIDAKMDTTVKYMLEWLHAIA